MGVHVLCVWFAEHRHGGESMRWATKVSRLAGAVLELECIDGEKRLIQASDLRTITVSELRNDTVLMVGGKLDCTCPTGNYLTNPVVDERCPIHGGASR